MASTDMKKRVAGTSSATQAVVAMNKPLHQVVKQAADDMETYMSEIVRVAVEQWLERNNYAVPASVDSVQQGDSA